MADAQALRVSLLIVAIGVLGALNSFSSRIRAQAFGTSNYAVTLYNAAIQCVAYIVGYRLATAKGWIPRGQLTRILRCDGWRWTELGLAKYFVVAALSDMVDNVTGFTAEPHLSTLTYALMNQATVPFTVLLSAILMRTRYSCLELVSVLGVICAAICCALLNGGDGSHAPRSAWWAIFAALTTSFAALSYTLKEQAFRVSARERSICASPSAHVNLVEVPRSFDEAAVRGGPAVRCGPEEELSFVTAGVVVNAFSLLTCIPIVLLNRAIVNDVDSTQPPLGPALACLWTCDHAAVAFAAYTVVNLLWNAALLLLTATHSALLTFLALKLQVPLVALFSAVDWPLIGSHPASPVQWVTLSAMIVGIAIYRYMNVQRLRKTGAQR